MRGLSSAIPTRLVYPVFRTQVSLTIQVRLCPTRSHIYPRDGSPSSPTIRFLAGPPFAVSLVSSTLTVPPSLSHSALLPLGSLSPPLLPFPSLSPFPQTLTLVSGGGCVCVCVWRVWERPPFLFHTRLFDMVVVDGRLLTSVRYSFFIFHVFYFRISSPFSLFVLLGCRYNEV